MKNRLLLPFVLVTLLAVTFGFLLLIPRMWNAEVFCSVTSIDCANLEATINVPNGFTGKIFVEAFEIETGSPPVPDFPTSNAETRVVTGPDTVTVPIGVAEEKNTRVIVWAMKKHGSLDKDCGP